MKKADENSFILSADEVCDRLNISRQTLYAYVSRGKIRACEQNHDARKSFYHTHDVENLIASKKRGRSRRAIAKSTQNWGEPVLKSNISYIENGQLFYYGKNALKLSKTANYEDMAKLLIDTDLNDEQGFSSAKADGRNGFERMISSLSNSMISHNKFDRQNQKALIIKSMLTAICDNTKISDEPFHLQLASQFSDDEHLADIIRQCLVLCADHELNPSTYAARIAASTHAKMVACILAAMATFSGTRHGSMTSMARWWIGRAAMKSSKDQLDFVKKTKNPPGFGHPIYARTDPRAETLLAQIDMPRGWNEVATLVANQHKLYPNIDFALAAIEKSYALKPKTGQTIFAFGRVLGWIAHIEEQRESGQLIRPRAWR